MQSEVEISIKYRANDYGNNDRLKVGSVDIKGIAFLQEHFAPLGNDEGIAIEIAFECSDEKDTVEYVRLTIPPHLFDAIAQARRLLDLTHDTRGAIGMRIELG